MKPLSTPREPFAPVVGIGALYRSTVNVPVVMFNTLGEPTEKRLPVPSFPCLQKR